MLLPSVVCDERVSVDGCINADKNHPPDTGNLRGGARALPRYVTAPRSVGECLLSISSWKNWKLPYDFRNDALLGVQHIIAIVNRQHRESSH